MCAAAAAARLDVDRLARARNDDFIAKIQLQITQLRAPHQQAHEPTKFRQDQAVAAKQEVDSLVAYLDGIQKYLDGAVAAREQGADFVVKGLPPLRCSNLGPPLPSP